MNRAQQENITKIFHNDDLLRLNQKIDDLLAKLDSKNVNQSLIYEHTLWDTATIAEYIGVSHKYAGEYLVTHHRFPNAVRVENNRGRKGFPRWYAKEVIAWVSQHRA